jgi:DNA-binding IclR family transcriptional regulator
MARTDYLESRTITGVERALDVLRLFADDGVAELGVTEIAERLQLSKAVVHRILTSFRVKGFMTVDEESRRYRLGPEVLTLGLAYLDRLDVHELARSTMRELVRQTHETSTLSVRVGWRRVYIDQATPARDIKMVVQLGGAYPLHAGASSKALLAFLPTDERQTFFATQRLEPITQRTITDPNVLAEQLNQIRQRGFAMSSGERQPGASSVAAPVLDRNGRLLAVISVCGPEDRFRPSAELHAATLLKATGMLSAALGHRRNVESASARRAGLTSRRSDG